MVGYNTSWQDCAMEEAVYFIASKKQNKKRKDWPPILHAIPRRLQLGPPSQWHYELETESLILRGTCQIQTIDISFTPVCFLLPFWVLSWLPATANDLICREGMTRSQ